MPPYKQLYRLPVEPSEVTYDQELWAKSWNDLASTVVTMFPGYHVGAMDPGVILYPDDNRGLSVSLTLHACLALLSKIK